MLCQALVTLELVSTDGNSGLNPCLWINQGFNSHKPLPPNPNIGYHYPTEVVVATNIAMPTASEAGTSGSSDMVNAVSEHWADIMSSEKAEASKMDKQAR
ncbi:hypothetical protein E4T56_gene13812 [Termitomyces sp. T112]|nr:hypothetical protein C0989_000386 [Termitomyces sp. Mn162]KAG5731853.1 hypothetical protein E4T56_gene13812 [Termitomyces sp. T112]KAH0590054.1 hypothetical protein H2248_000229 [Termitomyces sp. 'cryptogamus']